jgi:hypothetical protein
LEAREVIESLFMMPLAVDDVVKDLRTPSTKDAFDFVGANIGADERFDSAAEDVERDDDDAYDLAKTTDINYDADTGRTEKTDNLTDVDGKIQHIAKGIGVGSEGNHSIRVTCETVAPFVHTPSVKTPNKQKFPPSRPEAVAVTVHTINIHKRNEQDKQEYMCGNTDDKAHNFYKDVNVTDPFDKDLARNRSTPGQEYRPGDILRAHVREASPAAARARLAPASLQPGPPIQPPKSLQAALRFRHSCHVAYAGPRFSSSCFAELWSGTGNLAKQFINKGGGADTFEKAGHPDQDVVAPLVSRHIRAAIMSRKWVWLHFGISCRTFSLMQFSNGGSRTVMRPWGGEDIRPRTGSQ